jgi:hypothetical protein
VLRAAGEDTGVRGELLGGYLDVLTAAATTGRRPRKEELSALRDCGEQAASEGVLLRDLVDLYLAVTELAWPLLSQAASPSQPYASAVLTAARRAVAAVTDGHGLSQRLAVQHEERTRQEFIDDLLLGRSEPGRLAERAEHFGVLLSGKHLVIVARCEQPFGVGDPSVRRIEGALVGRFGFRNVLVAVRDGQLVCIVPASLRGGSGEFVHQLTTSLGTTVRWQVGVGRSHSGSGGVLKSYDEARGALDLADRLGLRATVLNAADLLVFPVLLRDKEAITDLVTSVLQPLSCARGGPQPLLETLMAFFSCNGNTSATARRLGITTRAVVYRLDRVRSLTGYSPTEPTHRFTLEAAVLGGRLLGWPTDGEPQSGL